MRKSLVIVGLLAAASAVPAKANTCQAHMLACATTMPVGGFCECTAGGKVQDGKVVEKLPPGMKINASAGGCGTHPNAPGCR